MNAEQLTQSNGGAYVFKNRPYGGYDAYNSDHFTAGLIFRTALPQPTREDVVEWCGHAHNTRRAAVKCIAAKYRKLPA